MSAIRLEMADVEEFELYYDKGLTKLFVNGPDQWTELERAICGYQTRMELKIYKAVMEALLPEEVSGP